MWTLVSKEGGYGLGPCVWEGLGAEPRVQGRMAGSDIVCVLEVWAPVSEDEGWDGDLWA